MVISQRFQVQEVPIPVYNGTDIIQNRATLTLYGVQSCQSSTYYLSSDTTSHSYEYTIQNTSAIDIDFDIEVGKTFLIEGDVEFEVPMYNVSGANPADPTVGVYLRTWDGTTETTLCSDTSQISIDNAEFKTMSFIVNVARSRIKKGDTLRLTVTVTQEDSANERCAIYFDPSNIYVDANVLHTQTKVVLPVVIE